MKLSYGKGDRRLMKHAKMPLVQLEGYLLHWQSIFTLVTAGNNRMMLSISCHLTLDGMAVFSKFIQYGNGIIKIPSPTVCTGILPSSSPYKPCLNSYIHFSSDWLSTIQ